MSETASARSIREGLSHPVIDSDGHWIEFGPHVARAMQSLGGDAAVAGFQHFGRQIANTVAMGVAGRRETREAQEAWWSLPTRNTRDRAAGWACQLLSDVLGHREKRRVDALPDVDPDNLDDAKLLDYAERYAPADFFAVMEERTRKGSPLSRSQAPTEEIDEFAGCGFESAHDVVAQFVNGFYFGCEADDPMNAWAFKREHLPHGVQLRTLFGSDIGHFGVQDMTGVLPEAYELVEDALIGGDDFRSIFFDNPVHFYSEGNSAFFTGTSVESAVRDLWAETNQGTTRRAR